MDQSFRKAGLTRREFLRRAGAAATGLWLAPHVGSPGARAQARYGGVAHIANTGELGTLDCMSSTLTRVSTTGHHIFETLFTFSKDFKPIPWLVDDYAFSADGSELTLRLREGVLFHDGSEMTSADVLASLRRWGRVSAAGKEAWENFIDVTAPDRYTVKIAMKGVYAPILTLLSQPDGGCIITPQRVADEAGTRPLRPDQYIGTGPYRFVEWNPGEHLVLKRFEAYADRGEEIDGMGGSRKAYLDELRFYPVTEYGTRLAGLQRGTFHWSERIGAPLYEEIKDSPYAEPIVLTPTGWNVLFFNLRKGLFTNPKLRQAVLAALDMETILKNAYVHDVFYTASGSIYPKGTAWYTEAGTEYYSQADPRRARQLAREAGYRGEPIRYMTTMEYEPHYAQGLVIMQQLQDAGFNVDLQIFDWSTVGERRVNPDLWDCYFSRAALMPDPSTNLFMADAFPGWWETPEKREIVRRLSGSVDFEERYKAFEDFQRLMYEQVPWIWVGHFTYVAARHVSFHDAFPAYWFHFWNAWIS